METLTNPSSDPPASRPRWLILNSSVNNYKDGDSSIADATTRAASCTSSGQSFRISFALAAPPATSSYYCDWIGGAPRDGNDSDDDRRCRMLGIRACDDSKDLRIVAAHDDSVLIQMRVPDGRRGARAVAPFDYFLYEAGAAQPPLLSLVPGCYISTQFDRKRDARHVPTRSDRPRTLCLLGTRDTGVLRRGEDELLVAQLEVIYEVDKGPHDRAELCVLRAGRDWELKSLPIVGNKPGAEKEPCSNFIPFYMVITIN